MHSSFLQRLYIKAFRVKQYQFFRAKTNSSPNSSFFMISLKFQSEWLSYSRFIFEHTLSIVQLILLIGSSQVYPINILAVNLVSSCRDALCHTKMSQNLVKEVSEKLPYSIKDLIRAFIKSLSFARIIVLKYSSSNKGLKKYFSCWVGAFITNSFGLFFAIIFLNLAYKNDNLVYFVLGIFKTDMVFLLFPSNYEAKQSPKYFIFLFKFIILRIELIFYLLTRFYSYFFAQIKSCSWENFFQIAYFSSGGIQCFQTHLDGYEIIIVLVFLCFGDMFRMLLTLFSIRCLRIAYLTLKSRVLFSTLYEFSFYFLALSSI